MASERLASIQSHLESKITFEDIKKEVRKWRDATPAGLFPSDVGFSNPFLGPDGAIDRWMNVAYQSARESNLPVEGVDLAQWDEVVIKENIDEIRGAVEVITALGLGENVDVIEAFNANGIVGVYQAIDTAIEERIVKTVMGHDWIGRTATRSVRDDACDLLSPLFVTDGWNIRERLFMYLAADTWRSMGLVGDRGELIGLDRLYDRYYACQLILLQSSNPEEVAMATILLPQVLVEIKTTFLLMQLSTEILGMTMPSDLNGLRDQSEIARGTWVALAYPRALISLGIPKSLKLTIEQINQIHMVMGHVKNVLGRYSIALQKDHSAVAYVTTEITGKAYNVLNRLGLMYSF